MSSSEDISYGKALRFQPELLELSREYDRFLEEFQRLFADPGLAVCSESDRRAGKKDPGFVRDIYSENIGDEEILSELDCFSTSIDEILNKEGCIRSEDAQRIGELNDKLTEYVQELDRAIATVEGFKKHPKKDSIPSVQDRNPKRDRLCF